MNATADPEFVTIAKVVKTQGRVGEVAAELFTDFPEKFGDRKRLFALRPDGSRRELEVEDFWSHKGKIVLKFAGVDSINDAEALLGSEVQIAKRDRAALHADAAWISDLVGCTVTDRGKEIGVVADVRFGFGEAPMLIVQAGKNEWMVPYATPFITAQDFTVRRIDMKLPAGLLDVDAPLTKEEKQEGQGGNS